LKALLFFVLLLLLVPFSTSANEFEHQGYIVKYKSISKSKFEKPRFKKIDSYDEIYNKILTDDEIAYVEPNYIYHTLDNNYSKGEVKWDLTKIKAEEAWEISEGDESVIVSVIDTGCDYNHPDLKDNIWTDENGKHGYDFANNDDDPMDDQSHGTHCSGTIGALHNNKGIAGVNKKVRIMCLKFLDSKGSGSLENALKSIEWAVDNGAKILSNSWGGGGFSQSLFDIIEYAKEQGVIFIAAAGNESTDKLSYPASYDLDNVISVAATDIADNIASFSNYGLPHVDIAAPGVDIESTVIDNKYKVYSGTSMATPHVAGAAALLLAYEPDITVPQMVDRILGTSDYLEDLEDKVVSSGRLNLYNMLMDIRPERPLPPNDDDYIDVDVSVESLHPYEINKTYEWNVNIPSGSEIVRVHFASFETEKKYDKVIITVGEKSKTYTGNLGEFYTKHFQVNDNDTINIKLISDRSIVKNGFVLDMIQYQN